MSENEGQSPFFDEFLDDYFAESDTHLTSIRSNLLSLESLVDQIDDPSTSDIPIDATSIKIELKSLIDELLRSFHTLKGLSGMVGIKNAEELAHEMESYLRALREEQLHVSRPGIEGLIAGVKILEETIAARRTQAEPPEITATMAQLAALSADLNEVEPTPEAEANQTALTTNEGILRLEPGNQETGNQEAGNQETGNQETGSQDSAPAEEDRGNGEVETEETVSEPLPAEPSPVKLKPDELERLQAEVSKGARAWHIEFAPDRDRAERGINVNYIRSRLQEIGDLIHGSPRLAPGAKTVFDFVVVANVFDQKFFPNPEADGISCSLFQVPELNAEALHSSRLETPATDESAQSEAEIPEIAKVEPEPVEPEPVEAVPTSPSERTPSKRQAGLSVMPSNVVRVDLARLDDLMRMLGELVISRARLEDQLSRLQQIVPIKNLRPIRETSQTLERQLRDLRQGVMRVRLVPIGQVFSRMQFVVRDVAKETHKKVNLELKGEDTEIDKYVVERLMDPLLHLVRNAISHGLESESDRVKAGKRPQGNLALRATTSGEMVILEIEDDGRGVNVNQVADRGRQMGAIDKDAQVDFISLLDILCLSGFSTKEQADLTSGRGVGLAVVKNTVQELGGMLSLHTEPGAGTKFTIELPLTLAIADALIVSVGEQTFAVPESSVREVIEVETDKITRLEDWDGNGQDCSVEHRETELLSFRQDVLPIRRLAHLFGLKQTVKDRFHAVIIGKDLNTVGIVVDRIIGRREIVVQPLSDPLLQVPGLAGATELGDGHVVLILDVATLIRLSKDSQKWGSL
jgi:two-component system chemotaxis sensor kinase CheA